MVVFKKIVFGVLFLVVMAGVVYLAGPLTAAGNGIFSLDWNYFYQLVELAGLLVLAAMFFAVLAVLAADWVYVLPISLMSVVIVVLMMPNRGGAVMAAGVVGALVISYALLSPRLKSYLNFSAGQLLGPAVRMVVLLITLVISLVYYLNVSADIRQKGFEVPDSLIETALKFAPTTETVDNAPALPQLSKDQIDQLKKNPQLLKQYGLDPKILDTIGQPLKQVTNSTQDLIKNTVKSQISQLVKPYLAFIPIVLALLFYFSVSTLTSLAMIFVYPLLWLIFYLLEQAGFVHFDKEMREVKKLVV